MMVKLDPNYDMHARMQVRQTLINNYSTIMSHIDDQTTSFSGGGGGNKETSEPGLVGGAKNNATKIDTY